jgi:hypothetical protein
MGNLGIDEELDLIIELVDELLLSGKYNLVEKVIDLLLDSRKSDYTDSFAVLSVTNVCKDRLKNRVDLYLVTKAKMMIAQANYKALLEGLE